jgi:hypothetical protein
MNPASAIAPCMKEVSCITGWLLSPCCQMPPNCQGEGAITNSAARTMRLPVPPPDVTAYLQEQKQLLSSDNRPQQHAMRIIPGRSDCAHSL